MTRAALLVPALALAVALAGCLGSAPDSPYPHTVNNGGVWHGKDIGDPLGTCTECHGDNLQGTMTTPSCHDCHGQRW